MSKPGWHYGIDGDKMHPDWDYTLDGDYVPKRSTVNMDGERVLDGEVIDPQEIREKVKIGLPWL